jgi:CheY-like chemotaxis protein
VVLLLERSDATRAALLRELRSDYDVIEVRSPSEALQVVSAADFTGDPIDLILLDIASGGRGVYERLSAELRARTRFLGDGALAKSGLRDALTSRVA